MEFEEDHSSSTQSTLLAALSTLSPPQLSHLIHSISALFRLHRRRLSAVLSSPTLFSLTLRHLHSLSLPQKSLLIARHLLSILSLFTPFLHPLSPPSPHPISANLRHLDSALLLLLLAEVRHHHPNSLEITPPKWRFVLSNYLYQTAMTVSGIVVSNSAILIQYIEMISKCKKLVGVMGCGEKEGGEVAASAAAVVALPSVQVRGEGRECVICKEEMREGRDVCELPCEHLFHWMCILPWLKKRNTCPCCRHRLPTDDISGEIRRLWEDVEKVGGGKVVI